MWSRLLQAHIASAAYEQRAADPLADALNGTSPGAVEMVEVKNTCPFRRQVRVSRKGTTRTCFVVADRGPRDQVCTCSFPYAPHQPDDADGQVYPSAALHCQPIFIRCHCTLVHPFQCPFFRSVSSLSGKLATGKSHP